MPVSIVWYLVKHSLISSGFAFVHISQSCGVLPRIESLTQPPTIKASKPFLFSLISNSLTFSGIEIFILPPY